VADETFFPNFGEHLLLKHLVEALDRRLPALPRPLVAAAAIQDMVPSSYTLKHQAKCLEAGALLKE